MAMFRALSGNGGGGGGYELALNVKEKKSIYRNTWSSLNIPVGNTKVIAVIGAIEAWCIYIVKEDGTLELMATGNDTSYYYIRINNGYFEGNSGVANTTPWVVTLDKV